MQIFLKIKFILLKHIILSHSLKETLTTFFKEEKFSSLIVLMDENTEKHCYLLIRDFLPAHHTIKIKSGEEQKTLETCSVIWDKMTSLNMDRHSLFINLGGGVIGDMGGFCAATYKRGIRFIQIPTTLLSQVDASIGGKLGVDFKQFKNHIGVFKNPEKVIIHTPFFKTLPYSEIRSGFAEIIKHCLIADKEKWAAIKGKSIAEQNIDDLVAHSISVKSNIVEEDPLEKNIRKGLNFGHTIGHAIESYYLDKPNQKLLHGEAIAIGMICESYISQKLNLITKDDLQEIKNFIYSIYPFFEIPDKNYKDIISLTLQDKKNKDSKVLAALLDGIGKIKINVELTPELIAESIDYYNAEKRHKKM